MKDFNDYKIAEISDAENSKITTLENQMKSDTGKDVILIAYESKDNNGVK